MISRRIDSRWLSGLLISLITCLAFSHVAIAQLQGAEGLAPNLPSNIPGIERPFPQDEEKFTFAIVGDKTGGGQENWPIFDRAMDEISRLHPDFAIVVGDLIQGNTDSIEVMDKQWKEFVEHASRIQIPFFFLPGNHDISNKVMYEYWSGNVGRTYYSFDYKECHFLLLNTEEGWRSDEVQFGAMQMEFVRQDIASHRDAKHIFIFMHRPVWYNSGEGLAQWETIESYLEGLSYTVFAGHFHNLAHEIRKKHRYFVLGATGAGSTTNGVLELGSFHHYSTVTVDGPNAHIAFIQPGSIHPEDIAQREFKNKVRQILSYERHFPLTPGEGKGKLIVHLDNKLDKVLKVSLDFAIPEGSPWSVAPNEATHEIMPGETANLIFNASYTLEDIVPLPSYTYGILYDGKPIWKGTATLVPVDSEDVVTVKEWMVLGPFDLGITARPSADTDLKAFMPNFVNLLKPEKDWDVTKEYQSGNQMVKWQEATASANGRLDIEAIYGGDFVMAYGLCYIYSPDNRLVFVSIRVDDITKVLVNGEEVHAGFPLRGSSSSPDYLTMPLKEGWNAVLIKNADYTGGWNYYFSVADANKELRFTHRVP